MKNPYFRRYELTAHQRREIVEEIEAERQLKQWYYYIQHYHAINEDPEALFKELHAQKLKGGIEKKTQCQH